MMRSVRRQLRGWKRDFLGMWGRLRSFHRVALGILLAIVLSRAAIYYPINPLKDEIAVAQEALVESEAPETVTLREDDVEIQELELKNEGLEQGMPARRAKMQEAIAKWPDFSKANKGAILAEFGELITQSGLTRLQFHDDEAGPLEPEEEETGRGRSVRRASRPTAKKPPTPAPTAAKPEPLATAIHSYVLAGSFENIQGFLKAVDTFSYPARIEELSLKLAGIETEDGTQPLPIQPNAPPQIRLSFRLKLYFHQ